MLNANSLKSSLMVTGIVLVMVFLLPWADRKICRKLGLNLQGGKSKNPRADQLLRWRQGILMAGFVAYLLIYAWLVFFSRTAMNDYVVHIAPLEDLKNAFQTEHGFSDVFSRFFTEGFSAFANVELVRPEDIAQFYMNVMVFVPLGYLLPYVFRWFRARIKTRPVGACFLISFLTENIQLMSTRGLYDLDDIIANTLGGLIGQMLYFSVAYVLTHPELKTDLKGYRKWRRNAKKRVLYPFRRNIGANRVQLQGTDKNAVWDFYVMTLGYRPLRQIVPENMKGRGLLLQLGRSVLEIHCASRTEPLPPQKLTFSAHRLDRIREKLRQKGIDPGDYGTDPFTMHRTLRITGPDGVEITLVEK